MFKKQIPLNTELEGVAVSVSLPQVITLCNVYFPNIQEINRENINNLIQQLPKPFIILGDFNSQSDMWGSYKLDERGKMIEKLLEDEDELVLLNTGLPTRFNLTKKPTSIQKMQQNHQQSSLLLFH